MKVTNKNTSFSLSSEKRTDQIVGDGQVRDQDAKEWLVRERNSFTAQLEDAQKENNRLHIVAERLSTDLGAERIMHAETRAERDAGGFCVKHKPSLAVKYNACWVCSREEESQKLEATEARLSSLDGAIRFALANNWHHDLRAAIEKIIGPDTREAAKG